VVFIYTSNEQTEKENRKTITFLIASKTHLRINLTKKVKDFYNENYKPLKKEIKVDSEDGKISHAHGLAKSKL
jgi:hypothetical protein